MERQAARMRQDDEIPPRVVAVHRAVMEKFGFPELTVLRSQIDDGPDFEPKKA